MSTPTRFSIPLWIDFHHHLRQDEELVHILHLIAAMGCIGWVDMPNTRPPVLYIVGPGELDGWSVEARSHAVQALAHKLGIRCVYHQTPVYLSAKTTPAMIYEAKKKGHDDLAFKAYPLHGTTGSASALPILAHLDSGVIGAIFDCGYELKIHTELSGIPIFKDGHICGEHLGDGHGVPPWLWLDAEINSERVGYEEVVPRIFDRYPEGKTTFEHITSQAAVKLVKQLGANAFATVCPQHLLFTLANLVRPMNTFLYCMPVVKHVRDMITLLAAVTDANNTKFGAGTDSAVHLFGAKQTACGCAAGCVTAGCAPQLYAEAFEQRLTAFGVQDQQGAEWQAFKRLLPTEAEAFLNLPQVNLDTPAGQDIFRNFLVHTGHNFHGLPVSAETFTMERRPQAFKPIKVQFEKSRTVDGVTKDHDYIVQLPTGMNWQKEIDDPVTKEKRFRAIEEQVGYTKWSIVPDAA